MRCLFGFICVLALGVMGSAVGCVEEQCAAACASLGVTWEPHVAVWMHPRVTFTYDVDLMLDGASGSFTCEGSGSGPMSPTNKTGSGQTSRGSGIWVQFR
jgi:hypothetical protein